MHRQGAWRNSPDIWATGEAAAAGMVQQQLDSCKFNFSGSMFWTYDTMEQPRLWNMKSAPEIAAALSPKVRPNPCIKTDDETKWACDGKTGQCTASSSGAISDKH